MLRTKILVFGAALLALAVPAPAADHSDLLTTYGIVIDGAEQNGHIWFVLDHVDQRFVIDTSKDPNYFFSLLQDSAKTGRSLAVRYDPDGDFRDGDKPTYVVREIVYENQTVPGQDPSAAAPAPSQTGRSPAELSLARGIALYYTGFSQKAHEQIVRALTDTSLRLPLRMLAVKTDGKTLSEDAYESYGPGAQRDGELVAGLAQLREWKKLAPDDTDADLEIAIDQTDLGDYDGALATLRAAIKANPKTSFWLFIHVASVYRTRNDFPHALATFDELAATLGPQEGMAYRYNHGWTLARMHRYDEALDDLTKGIAGQPDYSWAYIRRACVYASLGRAREAAADQDQAIFLFEQSSVGTPITPGFQHDLERAKEVLKILRAAQDKGGNAKIDGVCDGYTDYGDQYRERSPLLPPAS